MNEKKFKLPISGNQLVLICALVGVTVIFSVLNPNYFTYTNLINILVSSTLIGLTSIGITFLIMTGGNDLSAALLDQIVHGERHVLCTDSHHDQVIVIRCGGGRHGSLFQVPAGTKSEGTVAVSSKPFQDGDESHILFGIGKHNPVLYL